LTCAALLFARRFFSSVQYLVHDSTGLKVQAGLLRQSSLGWVRELKIAWAYRGLLGRKPKATQASVGSDDYEATQARLDFLPAASYSRSFLH